MTDNPFNGGVFSVDNEENVDGLNVLLARATNRPFVTPYVALSRIQKILSSNHIFLPRITLTDVDHGNLIFGIDQFGSKQGQTNDGDFLETPESNYYLYFEYSLNEMGFFDVYCEIVEADDLDEIVSDYNADADDPSETVVNTSDLNHLHDINQEEHAGMSLAEETFGNAFTSARNSGKTTFSYNGKVYNTRRAGETDDQWKNNIAAPTPAPRRADRMPLKTTVASPPERPVGNLPAARQQSTVASPPIRPVGSIPSARQQTTVATPPQRPVGSLPAAPLQTTVASPPDRPIGSIPPVRKLDLTSPIDPNTALDKPTPDSIRDDLATKLKSIGKGENDLSYDDRATARDISHEMSWRYGTVPNAQPTDRRVNNELTVKLNRLNESERIRRITSKVNSLKGK